MHLLGFKNQKRALLWKVLFYPQKISISYTVQCPSHIDQKYPYHLTTNLKPYWNIIYPFKLKEYMLNQSSILNIH